MQVALSSRAQASRALRCPWRPGLEPVEEETEWDLMEGAPVDNSEVLAEFCKRRPAETRPDDETVVREMLASVDAESWESERYGDSLHLSTESSLLDHSLAGVGFDYSLDLPSFVPKFIFGDNRVRRDSLESTKEEEEEEEEELGNWYGGNRTAHSKPLSRPDLLWKDTKAHVQQLERITEEVHQLPREARDRVQSPKVHTAQTLLRSRNSGTYTYSLADEKSKPVEDKDCAEEEEEEYEGQLWQLRIGEVQKQYRTRHEHDRKQSKRTEGLRKAKEKLLQVQQELLKKDAIAGEKASEEVEWRNLIRMLKSFPHSIDVVMKAVLSFLLDDSCPESISIRKELERRMLLSSRESSSSAMTQRSSSVGANLSTIASSPPVSPSSVLSSIPINFPRSASETNLIQYPDNTIDASTGVTEAQNKEGTESEMNIHQSLHRRSSSAPQNVAGHSWWAPDPNTSTTSYMFGMCWKLASSPSVVISAAVMGTILKLRRARSHAPAMLQRR